MLWLALLGEQVALHQHVPHHSNDLEARSKKTAEAAVLHCCRANLPSRLVHDVSGSTKKQRVLSLLIIIASLIVVARAVVVTGSVINDITHLPHCQVIALAVVDVGGRGGG